MVLENEKEMFILLLNVEVIFVCDAVVCSKRKDFIQQSDYEIPDLIQVVTCIYSAYREKFFGKINESNDFSYLLKEIKTKISMKSF